MNSVGQWLEKLFKFFASLQLAVIVIVALGVISAVGTILEARYDANYAQKMVYHSPYMYFTLALLCVNLINVMIDRLPWKRHHLGFILAHIGIVLLVVGALITKLYGIDGSIAIDIGGKSRHVILPETEFGVYSSFGSGGWEPIYRSQVDFLLHPPSKAKNGEYSINIGSEVLTIKDYYHYARVEQKLVESDDPQDGPAVRIQLQNANVNMTQWLVRDLRQPQTTLELGPARVIMTELPYKYKEGNEIVLRPVPRKEQLQYEIYTGSKGGLTKKGTVAAGDVIETGWMGLQMRFLKYMPQAKQTYEYVQLERPLNDLTTSAVQVNFGGQDYWIGLNSNVRVFSSDKVLLFYYGNRRLDLKEKFGFEIQLKDFKIGRYQGTMRAASYASDVFIEGFGDAHISMNQPLKYKGFTFYQASFQEDAQGRPVTSILSVNRDPGRGIKYFGSLLIVLGTIVMFYFKHYRQKIFGYKRKEDAA